MRGHARCALFMLKVLLWGETVVVFFRSWLFLPSTRLSVPLMALMKIALFSELVQEAKSGQRFKGFDWIEGANLKGF